MTAKHRRGKGNHKHEDNFFKNEVVESEVRGGVNNYALHLVLFLLIVIGGATGAWFCFQQHQSLTYLTDSLMGMQMKIVKLQSSHEEMRQSSREQHVSESLESRLNALEDSYALAQKQVGMALATAEQLKTSDLPAQVLSLHTEMKARLAEMQQATVSLEQLSQLQTMLKGKSEEFEGVRTQVEGLAMLSAELSQKVEVLTGGMDEAELKLEEKVGQVATLSATLDGQAAEVLRLKEQLNTYQAQLDASTQEMATVRALLESEKSQEVPQASVEEQVSTPVGQMEEEAAPAAIEEAAAETEEEEEALPADVEQEAPISEEKAEADEGGEASEGEAAAQDEAPVEQEDAVTDETAPAEEAEAVEEDQTEQDESVVLSEETAEGVQGEEEPEEEPEEENQVADAEEESHKAEEEAEAEEETVSEGEKGLGEVEVSEGEEEQQDVAAEEEAEETDGEGHLENALPEDEWTMQAFVPRSYLTPVRDEEAESQRKAKSRHARQTRRSTQGVTLTDLKEAQKTNSLSAQDRQTEEGCTLDERTCLRKGLTDDRRVKIGLTESTEIAEICPKWGKMDEQGNIEPRLESLAESPMPNFSYSSIAGPCGLLYCNNTFRASERWRTDENQNPTEDAAQLTFATTLQQRRLCCDVDGSDFNTAEDTNCCCTPPTLALCSTSPLSPVHISGQF
ncbi:hypothetical protein ABVT39_010820 [Epinephelus coioides]